ncbi:hypothetical protein FA15DRAFT_587966 [Coprinopsis marcescibilis]|uniref:Uncharacterized protein n=1 Tax=Coprinopsis marcescibilis TaxID=230819 RepID=A0A5C3L1W3_COPMA|nr:hypothetical protein FA15DRAFT_587966 [Coprinopsis marcescibilis]
MLSLLSKGTARILDGHLKAAGLTIPQDEKGSYVIDLPAIRGLLPKISNSAFNQVADICENTINPICKSFHGMILSDIDNITDLLLKLDEVGAPEVGCHSICLIEGTLSVMKEPAEKEALHSPRRRRSSASLGVPILIPSTNPMVPSIIITPCDSQPHESSCRVPYQDSAFGNLLTVPLHVCFNDVHPPLLPQTTLPFLENWRWHQGHWEAILPSVREQTRRGLFSRAQVFRRKASRHYSRSLSHRNTLL